MVFPPYQIIEHKSSNGISGFTLKKFQEMTIDTSHHFWKIRLYMMRIKSWTINCFIVLVGQALLGPFGIRCLIGIKDFKYDENIIYKDGVKQ